MIKNYLTLLLLFFFSSLLAQEEGKSIYFLYQLTSAQTIELLEQDAFRPEDRHFYNLVDSSKTNNFENHTIGSFLLTHLNKETVNVRLFNRSSIRARLVQSEKNLLIEIADSTGKAINDAMVTLNKKTIAFDPKTQTYRKKKWKKKESLLLIQAKGELLYFDLRSMKVIPKKYRKKWIHKLNPIRWAKAIYRKLKPKRPSYKGYMVTNQPKYQPGDTVKIKGYFTNKKGKPIDEDLELVLLKKRKPVFTQTVRAEQKGRYITQFVLEDSLDLKLDKSYVLEFRIPWKKKKIRVYRHQFYYEDYQLDEAEYKLSLAKEEYPWGEAIEVEAFGQYKTGLSIPDASVKLTIERKSPRYTPSVNQFFDEEVILRKKIWEHRQTLERSGTSQIIIPDSIFPKVVAYYILKADFTDSSGELHSKKVKFRVTRPIDLVNCVSLELEGAYVVAKYNCADSLSKKEAELDYSHSNKDRTRKIQLPFRERVSGAISDYDLTLANGDDAILFLHEHKSKVEVGGENRHDSLLIDLYNPRQLNIHYELFKGKKMIEQGNTDAAKFSIARKGDQNNYHFYFHYEWATRWKKSQKSFYYYDKKLDLSIEQKTRINPGETVQVKVKVRNSKGEAAKNVELTAGAINGQFKNSTGHISASRIAYRGGKFPKRKYNYSLKRISENKKLPLNEKWLNKLAVEDQLFYQLRFPEKGIHLHYEKLPADSFYQSIAQFAPYVIRNGEAQPIIMIYANKKLVYYYDVHDDPPYSFIGRPESNEIRIRIRDAEYTFDQLPLKKGYKLEFSIDENHYHEADLGKNIKRVAKSVYLTQQEKILLSQSIFVLQSKKQGTHILKQGNQNIHFFTTKNGGHRQPNKYIRTGPFESGTIDYHWYNSFTKSLDFESGFSYELSQNRERLYEYRWLEGQEPLPKKISLQQPGQLVFRPDDLIPFDYPSLSIPFVTDQSHHRNSNLPSYVFKWPENANNALMCLLEKDSVLKAFTPIATIRSLQPGNYQLYLVNKDGSFLQHAFELESDMVLYQDLSALSFKSDSTHTLLNNLLAKKGVETPFHSIDTLLEFQEQRQRFSKGRVATGVSNTIRGMVRDLKTGEVLIGANVWVPGTKIGTTTNFNGHFYLAVPPRTYELEFSYLGYQTQRFQLPPRSMSLDVKLKQGNANLESVVVGYGISTRSSTSISALPTKNIQAMASSVSAGLSQVDEGDAITIRGSRSGATDYYLDGIRVNAQGEPISDLSGGMQLRKDFRDYAYWKPRLSTDENGEAWFTVRYPDNTTQWKNYVVGMNDKKEAGMAVSEVNAFKLVMARLSVPRFFVAGDRSDILGKSLNYRGDTIPIESAFKVDGTLVKSSKNQLAEVLIEKNSVDVPVQDSLKLTYTLASGAYGDGEAYTVPIFPKGVEETNGGFHLIDRDTSFQLDFDPNQGPIFIRAEQDVLEIMEESIDYLIGYPHGCNEQTASRLMATLLAKELKAMTGTTFEHESFLREGIKTLVKRQHPAGFWGWWTETEPDIWMTTYILKALHQAKSKKYNIPAVDKGLVYLTNHLEQYEGRQLLNILELFSDVGQALDYEKQLQKVNQTKELNLNDRLTILKIRQANGLPYSLEPTLSEMKTTIYGGHYWGETTYHWYNNDIQLSLLAYHIFKKENRPDIYRPIEHYLLRKRQRQSWRNTIETARIVQALLPNYLDEKGAVNPPSSLTIAEEGIGEITKFPFEKTLVGNKKITIHKKGKTPIYFTAYQQSWNASPKRKSDRFVIQTSFKQGGKRTNFLKTGEAATIEVDVEVKQQADYLVLEIPIPAACSYGAKKRNYRWQKGETHREYFKDRVAIYCRSLTEGKHHFSVELEPRFTGTYTLNPAKMEEMYFPVFYGRNGLKEVKVEE